ncbi:hypothetical protein [Campylobacter sp. RM12651]|uniref:hypothetical protein n=1 Tax=Campylobacter sp. RM12651 TaxID=1660079 RepID=UPI001EFB679B|nr:hypothetical protein [Campylobacter sp. RM12651]ULO02938.1 hypothetical protein AVBRAN_0468 [Campylobacter sp. RM12651]
MIDLNINLEDFLNEVARVIVSELKDKDFYNLSLEAQMLLIAYKQDNFSAYDFQEKHKLLLKHILFREQISEDEFVKLYDDEMFLEEISTLSKNTNLKEILTSHCKRLFA